MQATEATNRAAEKVARYYHRVTFRRYDLAELRQEAMTAILACSSKWDAAVGVPFEQYVYRAAYLAVGRWVYQNTASVSVPINNAKEALATFEVTPTETCAQTMVVLPARSLDPETAYMRQDWKRRARQAIQDAASDEDGRMALSVLLDEHASADVARQHGVPVQRVYRATAKLRSALVNTTTLALIQELKK